MFLKFFINIWLLSLLLFVLLFPSNSVTASDNTQFESPSLRYGHAMVYDPVNHQIILFGGVTIPYSKLSDTWIFDCDTNKWEKQNPSVSPSAMYNHKMVYDPLNQKVILFGGRTDETWVYDPSTIEWERKYTVESPSARHLYSLYYDSDDRQMVLFGGYLDDDSLENDLWKYNYVNNTWIQFSQTNTPEKRYGHAMVYDSLNNNAILFGGRVLGLTAETWKYENNEWERLYPSDAPLIRYVHNMVYDTYNSQIVLFGGDNEQSSERALGDTWVYQDDNWIEKSNDIHPQARNHHGMAYDKVNQRIVLFGGLGEDYSLAFDDTWMFKDDIWSQINGSIEESTDETTASNAPILSVNFAIISILIISVIQSARMISLKK